MSTFIMLTRVDRAELDGPGDLQDLERRVVARIRDEVPGVEWSRSFATLGPYDYVDIFTAPDNETATKVATIVRAMGATRTEVWPATEWSRFKEMLGELEAREHVR